MYVIDQAPSPDPRSVVTYCRICPATCGIIVGLQDGDDGPTVTKVVGDSQNPLSRGFTCIKGRHIGDLVQDPNRHRSSFRRHADGTVDELVPQQAIDEVAARLHDIIAEHGPNAVALFTGTSAAMSSLTLPFTLAFWRSLGSRQKFSSMTVDQSAKWVTEGRMGQWAAGGQRFADSDVWMFFGTNPLISMQGGYFTGFPVHDGMRRLQEELRRGLQLVVVDPRRTELASRAEVHLQILPGTDATLVAGMLRQLLADGLVDADFCGRWVDGVAGLRAAVEPFVPDHVAQICGIDVDAFRTATRLFGEGARGMATAGTGPDMGPHANLAEHLIQTLNVVCGRYPRPGDPLASVAVLGSAKPLPAQAVSPRRSWEADRSPVSGHGPLYGEYPAVSLADEILADRPDRIRALIVSGANPASAVPDSARMSRALAALDLLVTVDPFPSKTAALATYVIAPVMHLERADTTRAYEGLMDRPFAQYTGAVLPAPPDAIDDWEFFLRLGQAMGSTVKVGGREYGPTDPVPSIDEVLASLAGRGQVPLDEVRGHPHGAMFDDAEQPRASAPGDDANGRFDIAPPDVIVEIGDLLLAQPAQHDGRLLLTVRRLKHVINSTGTQISSLVRAARSNPCFAHPDDLARLGLAAGDRVTVTSDHGAVDAVILPDDTLRPGVVSLSHGFGGPQTQGVTTGPDVNALLSATTDLQQISAMPRLTAVPVTIERHTEQPSAPSAQQ